MGLALCMCECELYCLEGFYVNKHDMSCIRLLFSLSGGVATATQCSYYSRVNHWGEEQQPASKQIKQNMGVFVSPVLITPNSIPSPAFQVIEKTTYMWNATRY
jgi:hypothetical protein